MSKSISEQERQRLTPDSGFNLVAIDYFESQGDKLYLVEHFEMYQDALNAKNKRDKSDEYLILYKGAGGEFLFR